MDIRIEEVVIHFLMFVMYFSKKIPIPFLG